MIAVHCVHCGARNRIRGRSHALHPSCGKCNTPLPPHTRWLRIPADLRTSVVARAPAVVLTLLGLLLGIGGAGWFLYPSVTPLHPASEPVSARPPQQSARVAPGRPLPAPVDASAGVQQVFGSQKRLAPLALDAPPGPLRYYVRIEDAETGRLAMTLLLDGGRPLRTRLPLGSYRVVYAMGRTWYGPQTLFGPGTRRFQLDREFAFTRAHRRYLGAHLQLAQPSPRADGETMAVPSIELDQPARERLLSLSRAPR